jgi:hypothetical protein
MPWCVNCTRRPVASFAARAAALVVLIGGCADPQAAFDDFGERYARTHDAGAGGSGGGGPCALPGASDFQGRYLLVISPAFSPKTPILFLDDITATDSGSGLDAIMTLTALSAADRETPVGSALAPIDLSFGAGTFAADLGVLHIVGEADPVIPGAAIDGSLVLHGQLCAPDAGGALEFSCGTASGQVTVPAELGLDGSTWTLSRVTDGDPLPEVVIDCAKNPPSPL